MVRCGVLGAGCGGGVCHPLVFVQMIIFRDCVQVRGAGAGCGDGVCHPLVLLQMTVFRDSGQVRGAGAGCGVRHPFCFCANDCIS